MTGLSTITAPDLQQSARNIILTGRVQGVGFRPFVYRTARKLKLLGRVQNDAGKVLIFAQGAGETLDRFEQLLIRSAPPLALPVLASTNAAEPESIDTFEICASDSLSEPEIHVPPDMFTCEDCLAELTDPTERRYQYPFINCTQCGPRYTLITAMPYDRPNTSMADFPLCPGCDSEYRLPEDRRFHAQPLACELCGPSLEFVDGASGQRTANNETALKLAVEALNRGEIVAVKGVGGYHLVCDAANSHSVRVLRQRKHRPHKPLAVMFPMHGEDGLDSVRRHTDPSPAELKAISDPARPIVLARRRRDSSLCEGLAEGLAELGVFLPYSPLHHRLLGEFGKPVVATSGNLSGEPVLTENMEVEQRLASVCDHFLQHNRPIIRPADDPVVRVISGQPRLIRPGRGIAPLEFKLPGGTDLEPLIATGGHMKNTVALAWGDRVVVSPHIGELDSPRSLDIFNNVINDLQSLYNVNANIVACDLHPGYASTRWAHKQPLRLVQVQHHHAHASALAGEHPDINRWLVFTWDGVGFGEDGSLWGGEALLGAPGNWQRLASFRPFGLVGGDRAGREPWRSAAALLWAEGAEWMPPVKSAELARQAWQSGLTVHQSSAAGRLFDAAAALVLGRHVSSFEGQGPMALEALVTGTYQGIEMPVMSDDSGILRSDWAPLLPMLTDSSLSPVDRAGMFHASMSDALIEQVLHLRRTHKFDAVGLSGGVFQNRHLSESVSRHLAQLGIETRMHRNIPANDGGLCFGQVIEAAARREQEKG
jgi:hydrogenase maturation protein HypF